MNELKNLSEGMQGWLDADRSAVYAVLHALPDSVSAQDKSRMFDLIEQVQTTLAQLDAMVDACMTQVQEVADTSEKRAKKVSE